jgi:DNA-binding MarR family transcriptional regulator
MASSRRSTPDAHALAAWQDWLRAQRLLVTRLDGELRAATGMAVEDYDVLFQLAQAPDGRRRMSQLADALLLARSSCTRIVGRLEERGWVDRSADPDDGRVVWASLTRSGRSAQRRAALVHLRGIQANFAGRLDRQQVECLGSAARRLLDAG